MADPEILEQGRLSGVGNTWPLGHGESVCAYPT